MRRVASVLLVFGSLGITGMAFADAKQTFDKKCAACHGKDGTGKTTQGEKLKVKDLSDAAVQAQLTDAKITEALENGVKADGKDVMASYKGKLTPEDLKGLVGVVRGFKK